jgi:hypothetical protein
MVQFWAQARDFSLLQNIHTSPETQPASYSMGTTGTFARVRQMWHKTDHSRPPTAEVKTEWSYTSTRPICLDGMHMENFTHSNVKCQDTRACAHCRRDVYCRLLKCETRMLAANRVRYTIHFL